jgi:prevent-host-death family protein
VACVRDQCLTPIGVRALRENLSATLRRVKVGERIEVTERGRPVAVLSAVPDVTDPVERLIAAGKLLPPENPDAPWPAPLPT